MLDGRLVTLQPVEAEDLGFLVTLANHPQIRAMVVDWDWPVTMCGQPNWLDKVVKDSRSVRLTVLDKQSRSRIGLTGLWEVDWRNGSAIAGIKLMPDSSPKGAGSDVIMLVNAWAFYELGLRRLYSTILDFNGRSIGAYVRKCGWRIEGHERQAIFRRGEWCDLYRVALLRSDFDKLKDASEYVDYVCNIDVSNKVTLMPDDYTGDSSGQVWSHGSSMDP
jgi:RimJ/RimL family protein N-acetyltransferase